MKTDCAFGDVLKLKGRNLRETLENPKMSSEDSLEDMLQTHNR